MLLFSNEREVMRLIDERLYEVSSEAAVVASLIFRPDFYFRREQLTPHHFTNLENGYLYYAVSELTKQNIIQEMG